MEKICSNQLKLNSGSPCCEGIIQFLNHKTPEKYYQLSMSPWIQFAGISLGNKKQNVRDACYKPVFYTWPDSGNGRV
jgi:chloramphenicol O-acetyltransferase